MERWRVSAWIPDDLLTKDVFFFPTTNGDSLASDFSVGDEVSGVKAMANRFLLFLSSLCGVESRTLYIWG